MTEYPSADDYLKAVQDPVRNFTSSELKTAHFPAHPLLGIPMPASGSSAVVFKVVVRGEEQALRFFIRRDASSRERYNALNQYFYTSDIADCVATSQWLDDAIVIKGRTWPLVRMQWVNGRPLDQYIDGLVEDGNTDGIGALVTAWRILLTRMQRAEFAHGDLQHGNVLVDMGGSLRLVDFDCSWITPFVGESPPAESGHRNYQRSGRQWDQWMDTFPGLVIYTSLFALSKNAGLWDDFHDGENLIFHLKDFDPPYETEVWKRLSKVGDRELDALANRLKECCAVGWSPNGALESLLRPRWWEQARLVQSSAALASEGRQSSQLEPEPMLPGQSARLPLEQPPSPGTPTKPLPAPKKLAESRTSPSIPMPRPPSGTPVWPHTSRPPTDPGTPAQGNWWTPPPGTPLGSPPTPQRQPTPGASQRTRRNLVIALALIVLLVIGIFVVQAVVSSIAKPESTDSVSIQPQNPTSPYTAMQLFGTVSNNGTCSDLDLSTYSLSTYDVEAVWCSSDTYGRYFYKYSTTNPDGWANAIRGRFSSFTLERTGSCYNTYSASYTRTTGEVYSTVFFVYQKTPFVARIEARASDASIGTLMGVSYYYPSGTLLC